MGVLRICGGQYTTAGPSGELPIPMTSGPTLRNGQGGRLPSKGMVSLQEVRLVVTGPVTGPVREVNAVQHPPPSAPGAAERRPRWPGDGAGEGGSIPSRRPRRTE